MKGRQNIKGDPGAAGLDPNMPVALPAWARNIGEGNQWAARVSS